jgi:hypothetical protein
MYGVTKDTTPSVFAHLRRHLLSASDMPSPTAAAGILVNDPDRGQLPG